VSDELTVLQDVKRFCLSLPTEGETIEAIRLLLPKVQH